METAIIVFFTMLSVAIAPFVLFAIFFSLVIFFGIINGIVEMLKMKITGE